MSENSIEGNSHSVTAELPDHLSLSDATLPPRSLLEEQVNNFVLGQLEALKKAVDNEIARIDKTKVSKEIELSEEGSVVVEETLESPIDKEATLQEPVLGEASLQQKIEPVIADQKNLESNSTSRKAAARTDLYVQDVARGYLRLLSGGSKGRIKPETGLLMEIVRRR